MAKSWLLANSAVMWGGHMRRRCGSCMAQRCRSVPSFGSGKAGDERGGFHTLKVYLLCFANMLFYVF